MGLSEILMKEKDEIIEKWFNAIISFYPEGTVLFLKGEKDRFLNPIRTLILDGLDPLYDFFITGEDKKLAIAGLESIIKLMALEYRDPYGASSLGGYIKEIINEKVKKHQVDKAEMDEIIGRIDAFMDIAIDMFIKCKSDIQRIRRKEAQKSFLNLGKR